MVPPLRCDLEATVLPLDAAGKERVRLEDCPTCATGRLPNKDFVAAQLSDLSRIAFV
jgi:hypothetical protein